MERLTICETDRGRYAVRPMSWAGIWNEKGQIKEALNHLALFIEKEYAEKFVEWKEAEEQGKLLKLPVPVGSLVYEPYQFMGEGAWEIDVHKIRLEDLDKIGKTVFLTKSAAEQAFKEMEGKKCEICRKTAGRSTCTVYRTDPKQRI